MSSGDQMWSAIRAWSVVIHESKRNKMNWRGQLGLLSAMGQTVLITSSHRLIVPVSVQYLNSSNYNFSFLFLKQGTHLSMHRYAPHCTAPNWLHVPVRTAQTTWATCSEHAHALHGPDPIVVGPSMWILFMRALCGQLFRRFCCLGSEQAYLRLFLIKFFMEFTFVEHFEKFLTFNSS